MSVLFYIFYFTDPKFGVFSVYKKTSYSNWCAANPDTALHAEDSAKAGRSQLWKIRAEGTIKIPKCVNVFKRLRLHDKAWCTFLEETRKGRNTRTLSNVVPSGCSGQGYTFSLTVFFFQLLVSLQLNDGYLFHVSNPLNIEPTLCHVQFQLLAGRRINSESRIILLCLLQGQSRATHPHNCRLSTHTDNNAGHYDFKKHGNLSTLKIIIEKASCWTLFAYKKDKGHIHSKHHIYSDAKKALKWKDAECVGSDLRVWWL